MSTEHRGTGQRKIGQRIDPARPNLHAFGSMLDEFGIGFVRIETSSSKILNLNRSFANFLGRELTGVVGTLLTDCLNEDSRTDFIRLVESVGIRAGERVEEVFSVSVKDGSRRWLRFSLVVEADEDGPKDECNATVIDLTQAMKAEEELRLANDRFDSAQETSRVGSWEWKEGDEYAWWSKQLYALHRMDPDRGPVTFEDFMLMVAPKDRETIIRVNQPPFLPGDVRRFEFSSNPAVGPQRHFAATVWMTEIDGRLVRRGTTQDVTRQVELVKALEQSEVNLRELVSHTAEGTAVLNLDGLFIQADEKFASMLGCNPEDLVGQPIQKFAEAESQRAIEERFLNRTHAEAYEIQLQHMDEYWAWLLLSSAPLLNDDGQFVGVQVKALDITHRKQVEILAKHASQARAKLKSLTSRERQVLAQIVDGQMNKVIANRLDISEKTVERHRSNLMKKLEAHSVAELVRISITAEVMTAS
ncbi:PAS domain S-box protein [Rhodopirellula sp. JC740]|uniref:PAS domain S-box protein n=1 Tax=Rhodopirellula halodulae TaxID=2894198 RepID=A0ABS8NQR4_9BACT|nr:PAS domain S-box protein [Rhodopirellula sp. JC740]MCC9645163.1 PAS domain S-box protein [Rhodopirellula sp. JC740]